MIQLFGNDLKFNVQFWPNCLEIIYISEIIILVTNYTLNQMESVVWGELEEGLHLYGNNSNDNLIIKFKDITDQTQWYNMFKKYINNMKPETWNTYENFIKNFK